MASLVTGIIGGIQTRGAVSNAEKAQIASALKAAGIVDAATGEVNPQILAAAEKAILGVTGASEGAAGGIESAASAAQAGVDPYAKAGETGLTTLQELVDPNNKFTFSQDDPSYQWRLQQGQQAIERSAAARGALVSGGAMKSLMRHGQGMASQEYQAAFDRYLADRNSRGTIASGLAGLGANAAQYSGEVGLKGATLAGGLRVDAAKYAGDTNVDAVDKTTGNTINNALFQAGAEQDIGNAKTAGHMGRANAWNGMLSTIGNTGDAMLAGGFSGGKGFSLSGMMRGPAVYQRRAF